MTYTKTNWVNDQAPAINATNLNNIEDGIANSYNVALLAVSDTAPSECSTGDKYYNTTTKKIYTATGTDTWGTTGVDPIEDIFYIVFDTKTSYSYDGTDLVSVGGGGAEVAISTTTPTEDEIVWINPNDSVDVYGSYISNEYGTSQEIGYSQEYVNKNNVYSTNETDTGKKWVDGKKIYRKVYATGNLANAGRTTIALGITYSAIISITGYVSNGTNTFSLPFPSESSLGAVIKPFVEGTNIYIDTGNDRSAYSGYIIIEYTKSS